MLKKIISGIQTGADRAGLDAGLALGLETGGWVPKGRRTDAGPLSDEDMERYQLDEHSSSAYPPRTEQNVLDSDGTVLFGNMNSPGCSLTIRLCKKHGKPALTNPTPEQLKRWLTAYLIETLNVAGNRERTNPGIYQRTLDILVEALDRQVPCVGCGNEFFISDTSNYYSDGVRRCGRCTIELAGGPR